MLEQNGIPNQRRHAETTGDKEGIKLLLFPESFGQGKIGHSENTIFDGRFQAIRRSQIVNADQLESVIVTAGDNSAQRAKEIKGFKLIVHERKDAMLHGHFVFCFFLFFFLLNLWRN